MEKSNSLSGLDLQSEWNATTSSVLPLKRHDTRDMENIRILETVKFFNKRSQDIKILSAIVYTEAPYQDWSGEYVPFLIMPAVGLLVKIAVDIAVFRSSEIRSRSSSILCFINVLNILFICGSVTRIISASSDTGFFEISQPEIRVLARSVTMMLAILAFERAMKTHNPFWRPQPCRYLLVIVPAFLIWL